MDLIGEFRLNDVDNCNEIYCLAFHELRQLKGQLFFSLRVAVPSPPPPPKVKRRRGNVYANLTLIAFPCLPFTWGGGGGGRGNTFLIAWGGGGEERLLILHRLGLRGGGEATHSLSLGAEGGSRNILGDRMVIKGSEGGGECQSSLKEYKGGL